MKLKSAKKRNNLSVFFTIALFGLLILLSGFSLGSSWGTAYGSTIPVPPSTSPTGPTSPAITTTPAATAPVTTIPASPTPGSTTSPSSPTPVATTPVGTTPVSTTPATTPTPTTGPAAPETVTPPDGLNGFADAAFQRVWGRSDALVAGGTAGRTWLWGPAAGPALKEQYGSSTTVRLVQYFDKSRMEITDPNGDQTSPWYVTNGLLARELVSGNVQLGENTFMQRNPALVPVAGDANDHNGPTYADFAKVSTLAPGQNLASSAAGSFVDGALGRGTAATTGSLGESYGVRYGNYDAQSGHNIAGPFWDFLNSSGPIINGGLTVNGKLFDPTFYATGLPLSEAYWVKAKVGGIYRDVLVQVFERRVLTYTPSNEPQWRVEMGNIGQHYYQWRYGSSQAALPLTASSTATK